MFCVLMAVKIWGKLAVFINCDISIIEISGYVFQLENSKLALEMNTKSAKATEEELKENYMRIENLSTQLLNLQKNVSLFADRICIISNLKRTILTIFSFRGLGKGLARKSPGVGSIPGKRKRWKSKALNRQGERDG